MFIHSGLVNQTMHCIVQINPFCPSFAAKTLIIPLQKQTSRQIHRHVFLARKETDLCWLCDQMTDISLPHWLLLIDDLGRCPEKLIETDKNWKSVRKKKIYSQNSKVSFVFPITFSRLKLQRTFSFENRLLHVTPFLYFVCFGNILGATEE